MHSPCCGLGMGGKLVYGLLMAAVFWKGVKEEVGVDGVALCSPLQVCGLIRKHAELHGPKLSTSQGSDAFAVILAMNTELWLEDSCSLGYTQLLKMVYTSDCDLPELPETP